MAQIELQPRSPNDRIEVGCIGFGIMGQGDVRTAADFLAWRLSRSPMSMTDG